MYRTGPIVICVLASSALADETIVIEGKAPDEKTRDRERKLGDAPFVTIVHPDEQTPTASVADALATSAGVQTRSLGGLGAYQSISVRGAPSGHTAVLVDGVPLARLAAVTTDLGRFAVDSFGEVELYRGAVPIELGGAGVGGAVNLVTRLGRGEHGERIHASLGIGSFGARLARVHYGDTHGRWLSSTTLGYQGATGDYTYFDDGGTPLNKGDDGYRARDNNAFDQIDLASRVGTSDGVGGLRVAWKQQGLPGSTTRPAHDADLKTIDALLDGRVDAHVERATARQVGYVLVEQQTMRDPTGELGLGMQDRGYLTLSGGASSTWSRMFDVHRVMAGVEVRGDRFRDTDNTGAREALVGTRGTGAFSLASDFALGDAIAVTPAVRVDITRTAPTPMVEADLKSPPRWDTTTSPRLGVRAMLTEDIAVKGSAGWYVRLPTLIELFGNRGTILGSPDLRAERGPSADLGVVWAPAHALGPVDRILVESALFATRPRDTIALISTAGFASRAANIGATQSYGGELVASARFAKLATLSVAYTRLVSEQHTIDPNLFGKALPRTPGHFLYARGEVGQRYHGRLASAWLDVTAQSTSFLDQANFQRVPSRALIGTGLRSEIVAGFAASLAVANVTGLRIVDIPPDRPIDLPTRAPLNDLAGYPMPGRSFFLSVDWTY